MININLPVTTNKFIDQKATNLMLLKKSLTHAGALISLIILVVLLLVSWDKCIANPVQKWLEPSTPTRIPPAQSTKQVTNEGFIDIQGAQDKGIDARDINVDLNPTSRQVKVSFSGVSVNPIGHKVKSYLLVMAKYDKDLNKVGALDVKLSEEEGGRTLKEDLLAFITKYSGALTSDRQNTIDRLTTSSTAQEILNAFMGSANKTLVDLGSQPTQEIGMFFELLGLVYKYKLYGNPTTQLKTLYADLKGIYSGLPTEPATAPNTGDPNYDYLSIDTDNLKAAANLKRAMGNYQALKVAFATGTGKPNQIVLDALKAFMEELIRMTESGGDSVSDNICNAATNKCTYTFTQVEPADTQGNIYYYKLGVGVVFVNTSTGADVISTIKPYTFGSGNKLQYFRVDTALADQERLLRRLEELERVTAQKALQQPINAADGAAVDANGNPITPGGMDAYINMLKPYLGNYPEEYLLTSAQGKELSLDRYINQSLATGELNINFDMSGLTSSTTASAGRV